MSFDIPDLNNISFGPKIDISGSKRLEMGDKAILEEVEELVNSLNTLNKKKVELLGTRKFSELSLKERGEMENIADDIRRSHQKLRALNDTSVKALKERVE